MSGMNIQETQENIKRFFVSPDGLVAFLIIGVGIGSFFLGRASVTSEEPLMGVEAASIISSVSPIPPTPSPVREVSRVVNEEPSAVGGAASEGAYVASKNGTKYHLPWCGGAQSIKEENKVWFSSKEEAEAQGYSPAANCKGI
jgi:hypothetical protein